MYTGQFQILVIQHVEGESEGEVAESHQVADRLHEIPAEKLESSVENCCKLGQGYGTAEEQFAGSIFLCKGSLH